MSVTVLDLLKSSDTGLTIQELGAMCLLFGITSLVPELHAYEKDGRVRKDEHPQPTRWKAMPSAWQEPQ
jgi:hypothetical protein